MNYAYWIGSAEPKLPTRRPTTNRHGTPSMSTNTTTRAEHSHDRSQGSEREGEQHIDDSQTKNVYGKREGILNDKRVVVGLGC